MPLQNRFFFRFGLILTVIVISLILVNLCQLFAGDATNYSLSAALKKNKQEIDIFIEITDQCSTDTLAKTNKILKVKSNTLNLREKPTIKSKIVIELHKGYFLRVLAIDNGWYRILDKDCNVGWVAGHLTRDAIDGKTTVNEKKTIIVKRQDCIARDGSFCKYANGIVKDTNSGFEWLAGPDRDTNWDEAKSWVENLAVAGGGWRMPTREELKTLYQKGAGSRNMTSLLKTTGWWVWSGETKDSSSAWHFYFGYGYDSWSTRSNSCYRRGFAVRSRR